MSDSSDLDKLSRVVRHQTIAIAVLAAVAAAAVVFGLMMNNKYRRAKSDLKHMDHEVVTRAGRLIRRIEPMAERPFFIFERTRIPWDALAPNARTAYGGRLPTKVFGTFPIIGTQSDTWQAVRTDDRGLTFPGPDEYYLRTGLGCFKILILDPKTGPDAHALAVGQFVSRNVVHATADAAFCQPDPLLVTVQQPDKLLRRFFASDQPLKVYCHHSAEFVSYLLHRLGYRTRQVQLYDDRDGKLLGRHTVAEVFLPEAKQWVMLDADYGAIVRDSEGRVLGVADIAAMTHGHASGGLTVDDLAGKVRLKEGYSTHPLYSPQFAWTPETMTDKPILVPGKYLTLLGEITDQYWILEHDANFVPASLKKRKANGQATQD
ncbi:MAG: hypothetical protein GVY16_08810 [Planctomycetes bacterium]|nr:hypothetical protein [Phycisphaerae bacterium]NBB95828.1 hypothetical protein [Planctomycetota bacterium]